MKTMTQKFSLSFAVVWGVCLGYFSLAWLVEYGSLSNAIAHAWCVGTSDTMVALFLADLTLFALLVIAWLWQDMKKRGLPGKSRTAWIAGFCCVGSPVVFLYLAFRD